MNEIPNPECDRAFFYKWGHRLSLQYEEIKQTVRNIRLKPGLEKGSYKDRNFRLQKRENLKFSQRLNEASQLIVRILTRNLKGNDDYDQF